MNPRDRLLERAAAGHDIREEAARLVAQKKAARRSRSVRLAPKRAPGREKKEATWVERRRATAELREALVVLAESECERCGYYTPSGEGHMHHTLGGVGRRRQEQAIESVAWLCAGCHRHLHAAPVDARRFRDGIARKRAAPRPPQTSPAREDDR